MNKLCRACENSLPVEEFSVCRSATDGLQNWCRACFKSYQDRYKPAHRVRLREAQRAYRRRRGVREREMLQQAEYRARLADPGDWDLAR